MRRSARCVYLHLLQRFVGKPLVCRIDGVVGKMRVLLKKPESTTSRPFTSVVQAVIKSLETIPSSDRSSKTFQRSRPRMVIDEPSRTTG